jgi:hypothetical protein
MTYIEEAREFIKQSTLTSSVYIGCDSQRFKKNGLFYAKYSTVIIVHMDSNKGCKLFHDSVVMQDWGNIKQRMLNETMFAVNAAFEVKDAIGDRYYEVHLDINPNVKHKSNVAMKEALGYVMGNLGITAKIKPHAFAAMHAADHLVRQGG